MLDRHGRLYALLSNGNGLVFEGDRGGEGFLIGLERGRVVRMEGDCA